MRIAIASGKGGAGKTTVTASLASVWDRPFIAVDTDVEAPNLHLFLPPAVEASETVRLEVPILDPERCTLCGACRAICRYKAIAQFASRLTIFTDMCHGCGGCFAVCPSQALTPGSRGDRAGRPGPLPHGALPHRGSHDPAAPARPA